MIDNHQTLTLGFLGHKLVSAPGMTVTKVVKKRLSWRERLLSWPWEPWVSISIEATEVPSQEVILDGKRRTIYAHPEVIEKISEAAHGDHRPEG